MLVKKLLYNIDVPDLYCKLAVYGIFDTQKVHWDYYAVSTGTNGRTFSQHICSTYTEIDESSIRRYGKAFEYKEDAMKYIDDFKTKWETGSNQTVQEKREEKLNDLLDENTK